MIENLKEHLQQLAESHTGLEVRTNFTSSSSTENLNVSKL